MILLSSRVFESLVALGYRTKIIQALAGEPAGVFFIDAGVD